MEYFFRTLIFTALSATFSFALPSLAQDPTSPQTRPVVSGVSKAPVKVWTNENISSVQGTVSAVGGSGRLPRGPASTSNGATFVNPKEGQIVHPGETIHIDLDVDINIRPVKTLGIISPMGFSNDDREGPPYSFTFTIPDKDLSGSSHRLVGFQRLALFGTVVGRKDYELASTTVDVEEDELPISFSVAGNMMSQWDRTPNHLNFYAVGEDQSINIYAKFSNGHELDVSESTYLSLSAENPAVVTVSEDGTVTAAGAGETRIIAAYSLNNRQKLLYIPVTVHASSHGIDATPATFNFGDVPSNTVSAPVQITITNHTNSDVHILKLEPRGFPIGPENCSNTALPPGGSCTLTVTFAPLGTGSVHENIFVPNSHSILSIPLFGRGI